MVYRHQDLPLHKIECWDATEGRLLQDTLAQIGLVFSFDHANGTSCSSKSTQTKEIEVFHVDGIHQLQYLLCDCFGKVQPVTPEQLIVNRMFPATDEKPRRAFTFDSLHLYDHMDLSGAINFKQFCDGVMKMAWESSEDVSDKLQFSMR